MEYRKPGECSHYSDLTTGWMTWRNEVWLPTQWNYFLSKACTSALGTTHCIHGFLPQGLKDGATPPFPHMPSWYAEEQLFNPFPILAITIQDGACYFTGKWLFVVHRRRLSILTECPGLVHSQDREIWTGQKTVRDMYLLKHLERTQGRWVSVLHGSEQSYAVFKSAVLWGKTPCGGVATGCYLLSSSTLSTRSIVSPVLVLLFHISCNFPPPPNDLFFSPEIKAVVSSETLLTSCYIPDNNHLNGHFCETVSMYCWWTNISSNVLGEDVQQTIKPNRTRSSTKNLRHQHCSSDGLTTNNQGLINIWINEPLLHINYTRTDSHNAETFLLEYKNFCTRAMFRPQQTNSAKSSPKKSVQPEQCSQYTDLAAGLTIQSSNSSKGQQVPLFSKIPTPNVGHTQPPVQWVSGAWFWPLSSI
jgi:hypothetical protein